MELTARNKKFAKIVAIFLVPSFLAMTIGLPLSAKKRYYEKKLISKQRQLAQLQQLASEYNTLKKLTGNGKRPRTSGSIISYLSKRTRKLGLEAKVTSIKPLRSDKSRMFEIRLDNLTLTEAVDLLFSLEKNSRYQIRIKRIQLRKKIADPQHLEMILQLEVM